MKNIKFIIFFSIASCGLEHSSQNQMRFWRDGRIIDYEHKDSMFISEVLLSPYEKENTICPICLQKYNDSSVVLKTECNHRFHSECINMWLEDKYNCPDCLKKIKKTPMPCSKFTCMCIAGIGMATVTTVLFVVFK